MAIKPESDRVLACHDLDFVLPSRIIRSFWNFVNTMKPLFLNTPSLWTTCYSNPPPPPQANFTDFTTFLYDHRLILYLNAFFSSPLYITTLSTWTLVGNVVRVNWTIRMKDVNIKQLIGYFISFYENETKGKGYSKCHSFSTRTQSYYSSILSWCFVHCWRDER